MDEIEKAFSAGRGSGATDGGTSARVFGSFLSWMQEKAAAVFVVATANDVTQMPPEFLRKGRFDEVFFLDLPTNAERKEIFSVHLMAKGRAFKSVDLDRLADASEGFVGSEVEQAINEAMHVAFYDDERQLTIQDILKVIQQQVPLVVSHRTEIEELRQWLHEGRARSASFEEVQEAEQNFVPLEFRKK